MAGKNGDALQAAGPAGSPFHWHPGLALGPLSIFLGSRVNQPRLGHLLDSHLSRQGSLTDCPCRVSPEGKIGFLKREPSGRERGDASKQTTHPSVTFAVFENVSFTPALPLRRSFISTFTLFKLHSVIFVATATHTHTHTQKSNNNNNKKDKEKLHVT